MKTDGHVRRHGIAIEETRGQMRNHRVDRDDQADDENRGAARTARAFEHKRPQHEGQIVGMLGCVVLPALFLDQVAAVAEIAGNQDRQNGEQPVEPGHMVDIVVHARKREW